MHAAVKRSWTAVGTEISQAASCAAAEKGLTVYLGAINNIPCEPGAFDAVRMHDVLEHLSDPVL